MRTLPVFDCGALISALDAQRADRGLGWTALADELWQQSSERGCRRQDRTAASGGELSQVYAALNERRRERDLTWAELAEELSCTPGRLTNLRTARLADMDLIMRVTQWLEQPAARFVRPAQW